jgi:hypothetical protein
LRLATITTFTTNHDHEDQRWLQAPQRRTLDAYHACLTDIHTLFSCHILSSTRDSFGILDFYSSSAFHDSNTTRQVLLSLSAEHLLDKILMIGSGELAHSSTARYTTQRSFQSQQRSFFFRSGNWILASALSRNIPPWPDCFCYFFPSWRFLLSSITTHTTCDWWAMDRSRKLSAASNGRLCLFGIARKRASEQNEYLY